MSERDRLPTNSMSNNHIVQAYNGALQTYLTDRRQENITELNNFMYATVLSTTKNILASRQIKH